MNWKGLMRADFGAMMQPKVRYDFKDKLLGFLSLVKPPFIFMTPFNAASAAVLAINGYPDWNLVIGGFFCAFFASIGANIFNRYADRERDKIFWPKRAIPSGRIKAVYVLLLTILCYIISLLLCWTIFNLTTMVILAVGLVFSSLYSTHLRDRVGYLSLPAIEGTIFLAGWAALAPQTIFTLTPWVLYAIGLFWQASHIMSHYMLHIKWDSGRPNIITPAFFYKPSPQTASWLILVFIVISFALSLWLIFQTGLSYIYVVLILAAGINAIYRSSILVADSANHEKLNEAWSALSLFKMAAAVAIMLDIFVFKTIL
jgi:4-hydroxybenzoate polyprenyltransferase